MKYFKVIDAPYDNGHYIISGTDEYYSYFKWTDGSYNVYHARIMGLTYASYLRMARDNFNAGLRGKGHKYPTAYFDNRKDAEKLAKVLDERLSYLIRNSK